MLKRLLVLCLLPALLGCGARVEVAKDKILAQVDSLLGEIDVKKKEAEIGVRNLTAAMEQYTRGKIEAKVKLKQVSRPPGRTGEGSGHADKFLGRLRDYLKAGKNVEISGKTYTPSATEGDAPQAAIPLRKKLGTEAEAFRGSKERLAKTVALLEQKEQGRAGQDPRAQIGSGGDRGQIRRPGVDEGSVEASGGDGGPRLRHRREDRCVTSPRRSTWNL